MKFFTNQGSLMRLRDGHGSPDVLVGGKWKFYNDPQEHAERSREISEDKARELAGNVALDAPVSGDASPMPDPDAALGI